MIHWILDTWWRNWMRGRVDVGGEARKGTMWVLLPEQLERGSACG